jgi:rhodanese-related sulfurtransferase
MSGFFSNLFSNGPQADIAQLIGSGAVIVDVRTTGEYADGHVKGAINIPLGEITQNLHQLRKDKPVITCCRSGARSGQAMQELRQHGYDAHNGGPWTSVQNLLAK